MPEPGESDSRPPALVEVQQRVRAYWERTGVPMRAAPGTPDGPVFRFTEGPPTANGAPHIGHVVARTLKDVQLRYRRMRGYRIVSPMAGWDCHGLPVELEVEKRHKIHSKKEIEAFGVAKFCDECRASVLEVASVWQEMSHRIGYWLDYDHAYRTMDAPYIESVWWSLKTLFDRGLLEKGYYVLPYCPRCETPLSSHEVAQGYKETTDPSVTVRFPLERGPGEPERRLLVWTTTPWTLPSNLLVAARPDLPYVAVRAEDGGEDVLAEAAYARYFPKGADITARIPGQELENRIYRPPFDFAGPGEGRFRVVMDAMVDPAEGTGLVHIAPSFGIEDRRIGERERVGQFDPLDGRGVFQPSVRIVAGKPFKQADPVLLEDLKARGLLERVESVRHTYPFCWRCSTPLIYRAIDSWFVRTSRFTERLVAHNASVDWVPAHLRDGRFGNFLGEAKDWALSRNRYWGTPLPVWGCPKGHFTCIGSFAELAEKTRAPLPNGFDPHRVTVDVMQFPCPVCGEEARREPYTIDGWYDSGAAPFAQFHYPFEPGLFAPDAPLDYIAEGLDQTRGWFYTLLVEATALFNRPAYRVCVSNGLVLDDSGQKMSKSKGNAIEPMTLLERQGGDAVRWAFLTADYTEPIAITEAGLQKAATRTVATLLHVAEFYRQNALADGLTPAPTRPTPVDPLDRWLLSRLAATAEQVSTSLEGYDPRPGAIALRQLVDDLSTWYLRRSRPRFWAEGKGADRVQANDTLSFVLAATARLAAPYVPFAAEELHQVVHALGFGRAEDSVHLTLWPGDLGARDPELEAAMAAVREEVEVGRELRQRAGVKSRIPLPEFVVFSDTPSVVPGWSADRDRLVADELNVRVVRRRPPSDAATFRRDDWVWREPGGRPVAALSRTPTPELLQEGHLREALRRLQLARKEMHLAYTDHVAASLYATGDLFDALEHGRDRLASELLADEVTLARGTPESLEGFREWEIDGARLFGRLARREASA